LESLGSEPEAIASIERSLSLRPEHAESIAALASCAFRVCDWALAATALARLRELPGAIACLHPFLMLASDMEPNELSQSLRQRGRELGPTPQSSAVRHRAEDPLRLAYLSPDFREHPVAHAVAGIIDKHDRQRFTPIGISLAAARSSAIAQRLKASFDEFIDASAMSDTAVGELMRQRGIDIAIDLAGHTTGARPLIFARRAAAMQVNYLGFPGSMGVGFMDFIVADEVVVPQGDEPLYTERVLRMPNSYLPFDSSRPPATAMGRDAAGLPSGAFVFCAFNNGYKINRAVFETWMSLLRETPGSILWLRSMGAAAANNLRTAAAALGVPTERLVFAPFLKTIEAHMRRLACADLFLDTLPYNAHTTAAEALWAGVPVVSCVGRTFAGRVGASLLSNAGLGELICQDLEQYRRCAVKLAQAPPLLRELRETLERTRNTSPVFDTQRYTRDFESLLAAAWRESGG
jgi:predicted O-linked N-acetylglucosamine transferase (SPINDLY family)